MKKWTISIMLFLYMTLIPMTAFAATETTFDLATPTSVTGGGSVSISNDVVIINSDPNDTIIITGSNSTPYSIEIEDSLNIHILADTVIQGCDDAPALSVPDGATITGLGESIQILGDDTSGNAAIFCNGELFIHGTIDTIKGSYGGGHGIYAKDSVTLYYSDSVGSVGWILGGDSSSSSAGGHGIYSKTGDIYILNPVGFIYGGNSSSSSYAGTGIYAENGSVYIQAPIGVIYGGNLLSSVAAPSGAGIYAFKDIDISASVEAIVGGDSSSPTGPGGYGLHANNDIIISGIDVVIGSIFSGAGDFSNPSISANNDIYIASGSVVGAIVGFGNTIADGHHDIEALKGSILYFGTVSEILSDNPFSFGDSLIIYDYRLLGNVNKAIFDGQNIVTLVPQNPEAIDFPFHVYVSDNITVDDITPDVIGFVQWHTSYTLDAPWSPTAPITTDITLYAEWESNQKDDKKGSGSFSLNNKTDSDKKDDVKKEDTDKDKIDEPQPIIPIETNQWGNPFTDISNGDWFYFSAKYVYENNLMSGTDATQFSPNTFVSRGMVVTVLYRAYGSPNVEVIDTFSDINGDEYYAQAVIWAYQNGIISGFGDGTFNPNASISRQDLMLILTKYATLAEIELISIRDFVEFADGYLIADYALLAIESFYSAGLVNGKLNNHFDPLGGATRAEFATILENLLSLD